MFYKSESIGRDGFDTEEIQENLKYATKPV